MTGTCCPQESHQDADPLNQEADLAESEQTYKVGHLDIIVLRGGGGGGIRMILYLLLMKLALRYSPTVSATESS